jgi:exopolysaccharide production protein ExoQ
MEGSSLRERTAWRRLAATGEDPSLYAAASPLRRTRLRAGLRSLGTLAEWAFVVTVLFLFSGALLPLLIEQTSGTAVATEGNALLRGVFLSIHAVTLLLVARRFPSVLAALARNRFLVLLVALAAVSVLWSQAADLTLRRGIGLIATTCFGAYLAARFPPATVLRLLAVALGGAAVLSLVAGLGAPEFGIASGTHAGQWRGIFTHKNTLGQVAGVSVVVFLLLLRTGPRRRWPLLAAAGASLLLVVLSQSASSLLILGIIAALLPLFLALRSRSGLLVPASIVMLLLLGSVALLVLANLQELFWLLGREPTLTGRTVLWAVAWEAIQQRPLLGFGYSAFWTGDLESATSARLAVGWETPNAHSGFLDLWLELGLAGMAVLLAAILATARHSVTVLRSYPGPEALWPILFCTYFLLYNLTESALLEQNSLLWAVFAFTVFSFSTRHQPSPSSHVRPEPVGSLPLSLGIRRRNPPPGVGGFR